MKRFKTLLLSILILALSGNLSAQKKPFFFIQLTDTQFGFIENNKGFEQETKIFEKAVAEINRLKPDFIVITGDLVNDRKDESQLAEFKRIAGMIGKEIPVYFSPGNHDISESPSQKDIDGFTERYGHDRFSFRHNKCQFIGLNSCLIKSSPNSMEKVQFEWLEKELRKGKKVRQTMIFVHYPFFVNSFDEPEAYFNIAPETRNKYISLFRKYGVDAVFAGHLHNNSAGADGSMQMITTSAAGKQLGKEAPGMRIIKVHSGKIESEYYPLDQIPGTITFPNSL